MSDISLPLEGLNEFGNLPFELFREALAIFRGGEIGHVWPIDEEELIKFLECLHPRLGLEVCQFRVLHSEHLSNVGKVVPVIGIFASNEFLL